MEDKEKRAKVREGLKACARLAISCGQCPYYDEAGRDGYGCFERLAQDAIEIMDEQEAHDGQ